MVHAEEIIIEAHTDGRQPDHMLDPAISEQLGRTAFVRRLEERRDRGTRLRISFSPADRITESDVPEIRVKLEALGLVVIDRA